MLTNKDRNRKRDADECCYTDLDTGYRQYYNEQPPQKNGIEVSLTLSSPLMQMPLRHFGACSYGCEERALRVLATHGAWQQIPRLWGSANAMACAVEWRHM